MSSSSSGGGNISTAATPPDPHASHRPDPRPTGQDVAPDGSLRRTLKSRHLTMIAMGGAIGSGGLGDLAFRDGYQRSHTDVALVTVVLLLILVQLLQMLGDRLVAHYSRR